jgi:hypothetical protein
MWIIINAFRRFLAQVAPRQGLIWLCLQVRPQIWRRGLCHEAGAAIPIQIKIHKLKEKDKKNALN